MVIRYAFLVALAVSSVWAVITMSASRGQMLLVDVGESGTNVSFWLLAAVAILITLSLCRFVIFGLPAMVDEWYGDKKSWIYIIIAGGALYGVFYLM
ncbi:MAG TPA: hypothetical protein VI075_02765 [Methyloceanibacter sp.]|jgi:hypothetical protein